MVGDPFQGMNADRCVMLTHLLADVASALQFEHEITPSMMIAALSALGYRSDLTWVQKLQLVN